jgi:flagellar basal-body rod protein FlgC
MSNGIFSAMRVSAQGLRAQRIRLDVTAENMANAETTRTPDGGPYRAKRAVFSYEAGGNILGTRRNNTDSFRDILSNQLRHYPGASGSAQAGGMKESLLTVQIIEAEDALISEYDPSHPDADEEGYVQKPNVDPIVEMMNLISATRAYEANATAMDTAKEMLNRTLDL